METDLLFGRNEKGGCVKTLTQPFFMRKAQTTTDIIIHSTITVDVVISHTRLSVIIQRDKNAGTTAPLCFIFNIKFFSYLLF